MWFVEKLPKSERKFPAKLEIMQIYKSQSEKRVRSESHLLRSNLPFLFSVCVFVCFKLLHKACKRRACTQKWISQLNTHITHNHTLFYHGIFYLHPIQTLIIFIAQNAKFSFIFTQIGSYLYDIIFFFSLELTR